MASSEIQLHPQNMRLLKLVRGAPCSMGDVYIKELVSNAHHALDKFRECGFVEHSHDSDHRYKIRISGDGSTRAVTVEDSGIGMTPQELVNYFITPHPRGAAFCEALERGEDVSTISQFGLGLYTCFISAEKVVFETQYPGGPMCVATWHCSGTVTIEVAPAHPFSQGSSHGTRVNVVMPAAIPPTLYTACRLTQSALRYGGCVPYYVSTGTCTMPWVPLWVNPQSSITTEQYVHFYQSLSNQRDEPLASRHCLNTGPYGATAIIFIPRSNHSLQESTPKSFVSLSFDPSLTITQPVPNLFSFALPRYLKFVYGLVYCRELPPSLTPQGIHEFKIAIRQWLTEQCIHLFNTLLPYPRNLDIFTSWFRRYIQIGVVEGLPSQRSQLLPFLRFESTLSQGQPTSIVDYASRMPAHQKQIYYIGGQPLLALVACPKVQRARECGFEVLFTQEDIDDYCMQALVEHNSVPIVNLGSKDADLREAPQKEAILQELGTSLHGFFVGVMQGALDPSLRASVFRSHSQLTTAQQRVRTQPYHEGPWWVILRKSDAHVSVRPNTTRSLDVLSGHPNYNPILANYVIVPFECVPSNTPFIAASYRHDQGTVASIPGRGQYYLTANYRWFLDQLPEGCCGWLDVLCIGPGGHELNQAFTYMGALYKRAIVVADYLSDPSLWLSVERRGWIYQESAFTALSPLPLYQNTPAWSSLLGLVSLCKLCERRGYWEDLAGLAQVVADACHDVMSAILSPAAQQRLSDPSHLFSNMRISDTNGIQVGDVTAHISEAEDLLVNVIQIADRRSIEIRRWEGVWTTVCDLAEALPQDQALMARMRGVVMENWANIVYNLGAKAIQLSVSSDQAATVLKAFCSSELCNDTDRPAAILGLIGSIISIADSEGVLEWCWSQLPDNAEINSPLRAKATATAGLGPLYLERIDDEFYSSTGRVLDGKAGNAPGHGHLLSICINGTPANPRFIQIVVHGKNAQPSSNQPWLSAPDSVRQTLFQ